ncbi:MAG: 2-oxoglutarate dehydrogenase complex dihydrolipoyllysine-residue succinyltransferase [Gammaproteobacteria bacterium]|nr:2-oxoglutarate dehydrogenase complex dihydrolipoyllysine-residue succinyltransferase [Gammaproteobacteria bacterium]
MSVEVRVPALPESVADATLLDWHKNVGDFINQGENMVDLETDKVVLELPAPVSGIIKEIVIEGGETVEGDTLVAYIEEGAAPEQDASPAVAEETNTDKASVAETQSTPAPQPTSTDSATVASPAAKKIIAETGVAPAVASGKGGRVTKQDVLATLNGGGVPQRVEERVPMTRLRKRVAERLLDAQSTAALLTTFNEINMKPIMDLRAKYKDQFEKKHDTRLGFMSFFVKAATEALKNYPAVNASIDGDDIIYHNYFDIGIAVSSPRGLVVPILRDTDQMSFADVESEIRAFGGKAKDGSLTIEEMTGGTFSITNGGVFGSMMPTPITTPPQSAILGMHNIVERPVVENGEIVIRPMMYVALTYDHRIIDGRESVSFLVDIKNMLEDPARLLLDV